MLRLLIEGHRAAPHAEEARRPPLPGRRRLDPLLRLRHRLGPLPRVPPRLLRVPGHHQTPALHRPLRQNQLPYPRPPSDPLRRLLLARPASSPTPMPPATAPPGPPPPTAAAAPPPPHSKPADSNADRFSPLRSPASVTTTTRPSSYRSRNSSTSGTSVFTLRRVPRKQPIPHRQPLRRLQQRQHHLHPVRLPVLAVSLPPQIVIPLRAETPGW